MAIAARFSVGEVQSLAERLQRASNQAPKIARIAVTEGGRAARKSLVADTQRLGNFDNFRGGSVNRMVKGRPAAGPSFTLTTTGTSRSLDQWAPGAASGAKSASATARELRSRGFRSPAAFYRGAYQRNEMVPRSFWQNPKQGGRYKIFQRVGDERDPIRMAIGPNPALVARSSEAFSALDRTYKQEFFRSFDQGLSRVLV